MVSPIPTLSAEGNRFGAGRETSAAAGSPARGWLRLLLLFALGAVSAGAAGASAPRPDRPNDLASVPLVVPGERLLINLMMEGRLAWFSWMGQPRHKPKLVVEWSWQGRDHAKTWQHGVDGSDFPQAFFLLRGTAPGQVRWGAHADLGPTREGHKHHFFAKDSPPRCGFIKADISEIPRGATITRAEFVLHIHLGRTAPYND